MAALLQGLVDALKLFLGLLRQLVWPSNWLSFVKPPERTSEIAEIIIYPIKACRGISVSSAKIKSTGFHFDRHWVVVNEDERGRFKTQRNEPKLALIDVSLPQEAFSGNLQDLPADAALELRAPGMQPLQVPLISPAGAAQLRRCSVWEWDGQARDEGDAAAAWLQAYLGKPCRLLRYAGAIEDGDAASNPARRPTDAGFAAGYETAFADGFPFLLASKASLADLNTRLKEQLPMNRFRPNLIVTGSGPWQEDQWQAFEIAHDSCLTKFRSVKPCSRCKVTTTDQVTAEVSKEREPLTTLGTFRSGKFLGWREPSFKSSVFFGWNLVAETPGVIAVGDQLLVSKWRRPAAAA